MTSKVDISPLLSCTYINMHLNMYTHTQSRERSSESQRTTVDIVESFTFGLCYMLSSYPGCNSLLPVIAWKGEHGGIHWSTVEHMGAWWSTLEHVGAHWSTLAYVGARWSTLES